MRHSLLGAAVLVVALPVLAACGGSDDEEPAGRADAMLANLPSCDRVPLDEAPEVTDQVTGLVLPAGARLTSVLEQGAVVSVEGTVRMSPLDIRADYEGRADIDLLRVEDEVFEAEVLARADGHRMYLRATALCADASSLSAMVGPDSDDTGLPEFQSDLQ